MFKPSKFWGAVHGSMAGRFYLGPRVTLPSAGAIWSFGTEGRGPARSEAPLRGGDGVPRVPRRACLESGKPSSRGLPRVFEGGDRRCRRLRRPRRRSLLGWDGRPPSGRASPCLRRPSVSGRAVEVSYLVWTAACAKGPSRRPCPTCRPACHRLDVIGPKRAAILSRRCQWPSNHRLAGHEPVSRGYATRLTFG